MQRIFCDHPCTPQELIPSSSIFITQFIHHLLYEPFSKSARIFSPFARAESKSPTLLNVSDIYKLRIGMDFAHVES